MVVVDSQIQYKPLKDYGNKLPGHRAGTKVHIGTLIRFVTHGTKSPAGCGTVKLRATRFGQRWLTCDEWFAEFLTALTIGGTDPVASGPGLRTPQQRAKRAAQEIDAALGRT